jgi:hypothetical protein
MDQDGVDPTHNPPIADQGFPARPLSCSAHFAQKDRDTPRRAASLEKPPLLHQGCIIDQVGRRPPQNRSNRRRTGS